MRLSLSFTVLLASLTSVLAAAGSEVVDLTGTNFESVVNPADLILVEFFAPWCGHCKNLAPEYEEAAHVLKTKNIPLAKVDCVDQSELCQSHGVSGYPTLKVFRKGTPTDYQGPRKAPGIISYMLKQSLPAVTNVQAADHAEFIGSDKVVAVLYVDAKEQPPAPHFIKAAEKHREDYLFGMVTDAAVAKAAGITPPALVVYKKFDEGRSDYPASALSSLTDEKLVGWLKENATPLLDEVSGENYSFYAESGLPLAYIFVDPSTEGKDAFVDTFKPLAKSYKGKINFVWIDAIKFGEHAKSMNLQESKWPSFVVQDVEKQLKWPYDQSKTVTADEIAVFLKAYAEGRIDPSLKSQAIPETQDEPSFTLVTKQFDEVVFDDSKDVFVEFYAPWCGHCKRLKPIWDQLGEKYAAIKDKLVIAKMDSTENDTPPSVPFRINGFPTLKFKPAGGREFVDYEGDRSFESLVEFVEKHAKNSLVIPVQESAASSAASSSSVVETPVAAQETHAQGHVEL